jgi:hypothetical protein
VIAVTPAHVIREIYITSVFHLVGSLLHNTVHLALGRPPARDTTALLTFYRLTKTLANLP